MRLLLYVLAAWFVLSILAALFFGRLCRLRDHPFGTIQTGNDTGWAIYKAAVEAKRGGTIQSARSRLSVLLAVHRRRQEADGAQPTASLVRYLVIKD
jgi:hypothetical protein